MTRPPAPLLPAIVLSLALGACATPVPAGSAAAPDAPASGSGAAAAPALLPKVPQPPERPVAPPQVTDPAIPREQRIAAFVDYTAETYGVDRALVRGVLAQAQRRQSIIDAMNRPAEAVKQWHEYRPIFLNPARIDGGIAFYRQHREALERVAAQTGVPAELIVAIIGVETSYGRVTGNYRCSTRSTPGLRLSGPVLRRRAGPAVRTEAGGAATRPARARAAMPGDGRASSCSSYRLGQGRRRRRPPRPAHNLPDVFASIANYFVVHGRARRPGGGARWPDPGARIRADGCDPVFPWPSCRARLPAAPANWSPRARQAHPAGRGRPEYWLAYRNPTRSTLQPLADVLLSVPAAWRSAPESGSP